MQTFVIGFKKIRFGQKVTVRYLLNLFCPWDINITNESREVEIRRDLCWEPCFIRRISSAFEIKERRAQVCERIIVATADFLYEDSLSIPREILKDLVQWSGERLRRGHCPRKYELMTFLPQGFFKGHNFLPSARKRETRYFRVDVKRNVKRSEMIGISECSFRMWSYIDPDIYYS